MTYRNRLRALAHKAPFIVTVVCFVAAAGSLLGQNGNPPTKVLDASALHPPAGANVAIVEFADLECPACARANPVLRDAAAKYKIPLVRHDFVIPGHPWSPTGAVYARWFDTKGNGLGDAYRDAVFASQTSIYNVSVLTQFTEDFARNHGIALPFSVDPQNKLSAEVKADGDLGRRIGITRTPTVFVVTAHSKGASYIEVQSPDRDLYRILDQAIADTKGAAAPAAPVHRTPKK